jgi:small conductance mechanosensitive channel
MDVVYLTRIGNYISHSASDHMDQFIDNLVKNSLTIGIEVVLTVVLTLLGLWLVKIISRRVQLQIESAKMDAGRKARLYTLLGVVRGSFRVIILTLAILVFLGTIGVNIAPILTSLGIAGLALSLGAQTLIKDYIGGLLVLLENQYIVGEAVTLPTGNGTASGTVEKISMRATWVRDLNGLVHIVPNGEVRLLSNASRDWSLALVNLNLDFNTNIPKATQALEEGAQRFASDPEVKPNLLDAPQVQAWSNLSDFAVQVRLSVKVLPGTRVSSESLLRRYALEALDKAGIALSLPVQELRIQK